MGFAWKGLFGMALVNIFLIAVEVVILQDEAGKISTSSMWLMAAINWVVAVGVIVVVANILGQKKLERPTPVPSPLANMYAEAD
jgi:hypothetical protein